MQKVTDMKILIIYHSEHHQNTEKIAKAMYTALTTDGINKRRL